MGSGGVPGQWLPAAVVGAFAIACGCLCDAVKGDGPRPAARVRRFVQDRFAIGLWFPPPLDGQADRRYAEIAETNINLIVGMGWSRGANSPEKVRRQLALCRKHGLKAIVHSAGLSPNKLPKGSACWGYNLRDEPAATEFSALARRVAAVRKARPGRLAYVNLFPNYANRRQLAAPTYEQYVSRFVSQVDVDVLCMDHYPVFKPSRDGRSRYCANLAIMRKHALARGIPFWNFFNTMPFGPHTDPTEAQLRWQIYASLAYGAKGVLYFCYFTPWDPDFPKGGGIIHSDGRRGRHWEHARRLNATLKNLGPTLMKLTSTGVYRVRPGDKMDAMPAGTPIRKIVRAPVDPPHDYLIGAFRHADGRRAVMLQNYRFAFTAWPTVEFDAPLAAVREVNPRSGRQIPVLDDSPDMPGLQICLDAGEGRLFLLAK